MHEGHRNRLIGKILRDVSFLNEHEKLEALLFYAIPRKNTNEIATELLKVCGGSIKDVLSASEQKLLSVKGIGNSTVAYLKLLNDILPEYSNIKTERWKFSCFSFGKDKLIEKLGKLDSEQLCCCLLDSDCYVISTFVFSEEQRNNVNINYKLLSEEIRYYNPTNIILAHNHPSGNAQPSTKDDATTYFAYLFLLAYNVKLIDHIIVSDTDTFSYYNSGRLDDIINKRIKVEI